MQDKIAIINTGLTLLGVRTISNIDQENEVARKVKQIFDSSRDDVLRGASWNFASKFERLSLLAEEVDDDDHVPGWTFTYKYPANCLKVRKVFNDSTLLSRRLVDRNKNFREVIATTSGEKALVSNLNLAQVEFTFQVTDTTQFDSAFDRALAHKLAFDLAITLTGNGSIQQAQANIYSNLISEAKRLNSEEGTDQIDKTSSFEDAR